MNKKSDPPPRPAFDTALWKDHANGYHNSGPVKDCPSCWVATYEPEVSETKEATDG